MEMLKKSFDWYNPLDINGIQFEKINITDGEKILFSFDWFINRVGGSNSIDCEIELDAKLVRSKIVKNKLRYTGTKGVYQLFIDKSLLSYSFVESIVMKGDTVSLEYIYYKLDGIETYFKDVKRLDKTEAQNAYCELQEISDEYRISLYDLKKYLAFYKENKELCEKAGIEL